MTPSEEIKNMLIPILSSMRAQGSTEAEIIAYRNGFTTGAMWRQTHPHWISVEDELPKDGYANYRRTIRVGYYLPLSIRKSKGIEKQFWHHPLAQPHARRKSKPQPLLYLPTCTALSQPFVATP